MKNMSTDLSVNTTTAASNTEFEAKVLMWALSASGGIIVVALAMYFIVRQCSISRLNKGGSLSAQDAVNEKRQRKAQNQLYMKYLIKEEADIDQYNEVISLIRQDLGLPNLLEKIKQFKQKISGSVGVELVRHEGIFAKVQGGEEGSIQVKADKLQELFSKYPELESGASATEIEDLRLERKSFHEETVLPLMVEICEQAESYLMRSQERSRLLLM